MLNKIYFKAMMIIVMIVSLYTISKVFFIAPIVEKMTLDLEQQNAKIHLEKIVSKVEDAQNFLETFKKSRLAEHKKDIKNIVQLALLVVKGNYQKYKNGKLTLEEAKQLSIDNLSSMKSDSQYIFITSKDYITIAHPLKKLIGKSMENIKDSKGNFVVKPMVDGAFLKGEDFNSYWWPKVKGGKEEKKLSYSVAFKQWDWIVGSGIYIDDINKEVEKRKKVLLDQLSKIFENTKIGKTGYPYIFDSSGQMIIHPNLTKAKGGDFSKLKNPQKDSLLWKDLIAVANSPEGLYYKWDHPVDKKKFVYDKIAWIQYNQYFDWYIGTSAYVEELTFVSSEIKRYLALTTLILLILSFVFGGFLFRKLLKPITALTENSLKIQDGDFSSRTNIQQNDEIGVLAINFNKMLDTIEEHIEHLDDKVSHKTKELEEKYQELIRTQAQLIQSEKMASLGGMVAGVAHEINTPVGMALTGITHLEDETKEIITLYETDDMSEEEFTHYLNSNTEINKSIIVNLTKAANLIKSFKQVAVDQSSDENRKFNFKEYIDEILLSLYNKTKKTNHTFEINIDDKLEINSNPGAFSQIITNFVMNSIIHGLEDIDSGLIIIEAYKEGGNLILNYKDNGCGLSSDAKNKIFDPFYTTNRVNGGSGLGMNIVYNIITQKLEGTIDIISEINGGVEFILTIPIKD